MSTIICIGCGKSKRDEVCAARDMYTGTLFAARRRHAEQNAPNLWWILSAKYGLLPPGAVISPYDLRIKDLHLLDQVAWRLDVVKALIDQLPDHVINTPKRLRDVVVELHAGADYAEPLLDVITAAGMSWSWPVKGMSQGEQMAFYKSAAALTGGRLGQWRHTTS